AWRDPPRLVRRAHCPGATPPASPPHFFCGARGGVLACPALLAAPGGEKVLSAPPAVRGYLRSDSYLPITVSGARPCLTSLRSPPPNSSPTRTSKASRTCPTWPSSTSPPAGPASPPVTAPY